MVGAEHWAVCVSDELLSGAGGLQLELLRALFPFEHPCFGQGPDPISQAMLWKVDECLDLFDGGDSPLHSFYDAVVNAVLEDWVCWSIAGGLWLMRGP